MDRVGVMEQGYGGQYGLLCTHGRKTAARRYAGLAGEPQPAPAERPPGRARGAY